MNDLLSEALRAEPYPEPSENDPERLATRRRRRSVRLLQVGASCGIDTGLLAGFAALGVCTWELVALYGGLAFGSTLVFLMVVQWPGIGAQHASRLTAAQVATALAIQGLAIYVAPGMTVFFVPLLFLIYAFASLSMDLRTMMAYAALNTLALVPLFASGDPARLLPALDARATLLLGATLMITLVRCIIVGDLGYRMRARILARQLESEATALAMEARITERTYALTRANKELSDANRQLQAYSYGMVHEFRGPLRAIDSYLALLDEDFRASAQHADARVLIERSREAGTRMSGLVDDLAKLAALGTARATPADLDLAMLATQVMDECRARAPGRRIEWVCPASLPARADARLMRAALEVLLDNACKFTARRTDARVEFGSRVVEGRTEYFVRDNGAGFDSAYGDKLFGIFQRLHGREEFEGRGVGLAVLQRIIALHGGTVRAEGARDAGATFLFTLGEA